GCGRSWGAAGSTWDPGGPGSSISRGIASTACGTTHQRTRCTSRGSTSPRPTFGGPSPRPAAPTLSPSTPQPTACDCYPTRLGLPSPERAASNQRVVAELEQPVAGHPLDD